jgi:exodeoxyribonuclease VII large subunit
VQGDGAAKQIIAALKYFNELAEPPEIIAIVRGGGSRDDLVAFDDEPLVRAVAASRVPVITGIGHEIDTTLADLAADVRASTPSNAAEILVPERRAIIASVDARLSGLIAKTENQLKDLNGQVAGGCSHLLNRLDGIVEKTENQLKILSAALKQLNPRTVLQRGYAIMRDESGRIVNTSKKGSTIHLETNVAIIEAEVQEVTTI